MSLYTITEKDEAGEDVASYALSANGRIDIIRPTTNDNLWGSLWSKCLGVFLPAGYPHTVTNDYMWYQIYDSLQAFSSSIAGLLSSRAVLEGVGVGDASASPTAALLLSIIQESMGRLATILFAYRLGTSLEPECKMYRLAADIFNDMAMVIDCLSPALPRAPKVVLLSFSSILRALCGVAAGSSKASLSAHFARCGNLGELNAKDSSQETVISLIGLLAGSIVVSYITTPFATWTWLIALLSIHLAMNHAAVRAVSMRSLNRQRANIVMSEYFDSKGILTPEEVSFRERIFEWDGVLRWKGSAPFATARIGISLQDMIITLAQAHHSTGAVRDSNLILQGLIKIFKGEDFLFWYDVRQRAAYIVLKAGGSANGQLKAWTLSLYCAHHLTNQDATSAPPDKIMDQIGGLLREVSSQWDELMVRLKAAGWDTETANLETTSGNRVHL